VQKSIGDNYFHDINIEMLGRSDKNYLAGGGIIGLRSTRGSVTIGSITGNYFDKISIKTDNKISTNHNMSPYIEGGGIIGLDAVATSSANYQGKAFLGDLDSNLFTNIIVDSSDIIQGGGIIGLNNNSKFIPISIQIPGYDCTSTDNTTCSLLNTARNNIFGNGETGNITINALHAIRGGGIIGLNGLNNSMSVLNELTNNIFAGINVTSETSYIKGGGIVGLQTNNSDEADLKSIYDNSTPKFDTEEASTFVIDPASDYVSTYLGLVKQNIFYNINISTGSVIEGGGIIGVRSNANMSIIGTIESNIFKKIKIDIDTLIPMNLGHLIGGGIIGTRSYKDSSITLINNNYFEDIIINVDKNLEGGGVIGVAVVESLNQGTAAVIGPIKNNKFNNIMVNSDLIKGGGIIGNNSKDGLSGMLVVDIDDVTGQLISSLDNNYFNQLTVTSANGLYGGGIIGANTESGMSFIGGIDNSIFTNNTIRAKYIEGGGIIGLNSSSGQDDMSFLWRSAGNIFQNSNITVDLYIDGGGIIGVTGGNQLFAGIRSIEDTLFTNNTIRAKNGIIMGGLVFSYGVQGGLTINDSWFVNNNFYSDITDNSAYKDKENKNNNYPLDPKVYGVITIDTGNNYAENPIQKVILIANDGNSTVFSNNNIYENGVHRTNSLYFGIIPEIDFIDSKALVSQDDADSDAELEIDARKGGYIGLFDPINVNQNNNKNFKMNILGNGGEFLWGGKNIFSLTGTQNPADNLVIFQSGSRTSLLSGMTLEAKGHNFRLEQGARLNIDGHNQIKVNEASLAGTIWFNINNNATTQYHRENLPKNDDALLIIDTPNPINIEGMTILLDSLNVNAQVQADDAIYYLIDTVGVGRLVGQPANATVSARQGLLKVYNFNIDTVGFEDNFFDEANKNLVLYLENEPYLLPESRILTEGQAIGAAFLSRAGAWLADHSYLQADLALAACGGCEREAQGWWLPVFGLDGAWLETGRNSDVTVESVTALAGAVYHTNLTRANLLVGGFLEASYGKYDLESGYGTLGAPVVEAEGKLSSIAWGALTRLSLPAGLRFEASGRVGRLVNEFESVYFDNEAGDSLHYKTNTPFFSVHGGLGWTRRLGEFAALDFVGRYFWTRQNGESFALSTGETVTFAPVVSQRVRAGARYTGFKADSRLSWYGGLYWEREFDGESLGRALGQEFGSDELKGDTGLAEIGLSLKPSPEVPWSLEAGFQGFLGQNRGFSGGVRLSLDF
jgi:hypothetical protein